MVLNHIAAILFFSGPLFYIGLVMVVDPAGIAAIPELLACEIREFRRALSGRPSERQPLKAVDIAASRRARRALRFAGMALVVWGLLFAVIV